MSDLVHAVRMTVGREHADVLYFEHCPLRGVGTGPRWTWHAYRPPAPGRRVLILSDLGMGGSALDPRRGTPAEWERFGRLLERAGSAAIAFVPYPRHRWEPWATGVFPMVPWDRHTTAGWVAAHLA